MQVTTSRTFNNIRFKKRTAQRFQEFSRRFFKTHTEALQTMLDFFFYNEISPKENLGPTARTLEQNMKKRYNALIAIIRDVEKHQTQPTAAMMQLLFEHTPPNNKQPAMVAAKQKERSQKDDAFFASAFESIELQKENTTLKQQLGRTRTELADLLHKVQVVKNSFGKTMLQLNMDIEEFEAIKSSLNP